MDTHSICRDDLRALHGLLFCNVHSNCTIYVGFLGLVVLLAIKFCSSFQGGVWRQPFSRMHAQQAISAASCYPSVAPASLVLCSYQAKLGKNILQIKVEVFLEKNLGITV